MRGVQVPAKTGFFGYLRLDKRAAIAGSAFLGVLALSILFFTLFGNSRIKRVFFFPMGASGRLVTEARFVPNYGDIERDIGELVNGEILGPVDHGMKLLIPRDVTVGSLFVRDRILYLDLSADFAVLGRELPLTGADSLGVLRKSISFNFPGIRDIIFLVDGQAPAYAQNLKIR
jgi:hypothetical protein